MKLHLAGPALGPDDEDDCPTQPLERPSFADLSQRISETRIRVDATRARIDARCEAMRNRRSGR